MHPPTLLDIVWPDVPNPFPLAVTVTPPLTGPLPALKVESVSRSKDIVSDTLETLTPEVTIAKFVEDVEDASLTLKPESESHIERSADESDGLNFWLKSETAKPIPKTDTIIDPVDGPLNGLGTLPADELRHWLKQVLEVEKFDEFPKFCDNSLTKDETFLMEELKHWKKHVLEIEKIDWFPAVPFWEVFMANDILAPCKIPLSYVTDFVIDEGLSPILNTTALVAKKFSAFLHPTDVSDLQAVASHFVSRMLRPVVRSYSPNSLPYHWLIFKKNVGATIEQLDALTHFFVRFCALLKLASELFKLKFKSIADERGAKLNCCWNDTTGPSYDIALLKLPTCATRR
jgi:hypothetical protein